MDDVEFEDYSEGEYEQLRIQLKDERECVQNKTFTNWANAILQTANLKIEDLFTDLTNGKILMKLLEILSGENLGKPHRAIMRVHKIENINRCLEFLASQVYFQNVGAEDIVDGNPRITLGLIWIIILQFHIRAFDIEEDEESTEKSSAKDALLHWCQSKTAEYPEVNIQNFTNSWRDGLGFCALIHAHRRDLIDYGSLSHENHIENLNYAFDVAAFKLGIPKILDAEDVDVTKPDMKSIMTYVASYYNYFENKNAEMAGGNMTDKNNLENPRGQHFVECDDCETRPAQFYCKTCQGRLCEDCKTTHETRRLTQGHEVMSLSRYLSESSEYPDVKNKDQRESNIKRKLKEKMNEIENEFIPALEKIRNERYDKKERLHGTLQGIVSEINDHCDDVIERMVQIKERHLKELQEQHENIASSIDHDIATITGKIGELGNCRTQIEECLNFQGISSNENLYKRINGAKALPPLTSFQIGEFCPGPASDDNLQIIIGEFPVFSFSD